MIISRTPFRVSFAGGSTDLRSFYKHEDGAVLSTTIDKYLWVTVRRQLGLVEHRYRLSYSKQEFCDHIKEIEHPLIQAALRIYEVDYPVAIHTESDIPAYSGLGSSSAFAVGLIHALHALHGKHITKSELAKQAANLEVNVLGRCIGKQDHYASSYGGLNTFTFHADESVDVEPVVCQKGTYEALQNHLQLFYTGIKRDAAKILKNQEDEGIVRDVLRLMKAQVGYLRKELECGLLPHKFGRMLNVGWQFKKSLSSKVSNPQINEWYSTALNAGAIGGKLLGAGGGGFLLFLVEPEHQEAVTKVLPLYRVPFRFDNTGSQIIYRE